MQEVIHLRWGELRRIQEASRQRTKAMRAELIGELALPKTLDECPPSGPDHTILYRGSSADGAALFLQTKESRYVMTWMACSDFSSFSSDVMYFTPDLEVAQTFAKYIAKVKVATPSVILCMKIPRKIIEDMRVDQPVSDTMNLDEWKELV